MSQKAKKFVIKEATKKRCKIFPIDEKNAKKFRVISLELYRYFHEVSTIEFSLYFRVEAEMIEFIRPRELSKELLQKMWNATQVMDADVEICVLKNDFPAFENMINKVRARKFADAKIKDPTLDSHVLNVFGDLSAASQMIVKGGIDTQVAEKAISAVNHLMTGQIDSDAAIGTLSRMIACDSTLYDHSATVAMLSGIIATKHLQKPLGQQEGQIVARCGLYHDAGKTCIPSAVLNKPGSFTPEEYEIMKTHTILGYEELNKAIRDGAPIEDIVALVALEHHERFTGHGYPHGKKGRLEDHKDGIHLYTRIVSIADVYSALLMKRVYKEAFDADKALGIMKKISDRDFDQDIFEPFYQNVVKSIQVFAEKEQKRSRIMMIDEKESFAAAILEQKNKKT